MDVDTHPIFMLSRFRLTDGRSSSGRFCVLAASRQKLESARGIHTRVENPDHQDAVLLGPEENYVRAKLEAPE
jgi:hypothetical protein